MNTAGSEVANVRAVLRWYRCRPRALLIALALGAIPWLLFGWHQMTLPHSSVPRARSTTMGYIHYADAAKRQWKREFECPLYLDGSGYEIRLLLADFDAEFLETVNPTHLSPVRALDLRGAHVTDSGLKALSGLDQLLSLDLAGADITDGGLVNLATLKQLRWLNLARTQVSDAGLQHLRDLTELETLDVSDTQVTTDAVTEFWKARPNRKPSPKRRP